MRALDPALRLGDEGLSTGDVITVGGLEMHVVPTPGHTADSLSFHLPADRAVLTGDTILGRGTTVVAHPDGRLGDYLDSLRQLRSLTVDDGVHTVLPGHGPVLDDAQGAVEFYLAHRAHRLAQVETAVEAGHRTAPEVVAQVYADVDRTLWPHGGALGAGSAGVPGRARADLTHGCDMVVRGPDRGPWHAWRAPPGGGALHVVRRRCPASANASRGAPRPAGSRHAPPGAASRGPRSRRAPC